MIKNRSFFKAISIPVLLIAFFTLSCKKNNSGPGSGNNGPDVTFFTLNQDNSLSLFNGKNTSSALATLPVTGMQSGELIVGIDFRPNTGQLFGISNASRLYILTPSTGAATVVGTTPFSPAIDGAVLGFDFNPTVDRIRVVTSSGQNLRLNPETGAVAFTDGSVNGAPSASITAVAYTQNRAGATTTVLFDIDVVNNKLYKQNPPNDGTLVEVGDLGVDVETAGGFDISPDSAYALAALTVAGTSSLYTINLSTGAATKAGDFPGAVNGLAIPTEAIAYAASANNELLILNPATGSISFTKPVTGLQPAENILGIDMRPATGQIFALGSTSRLYLLNVSTGAATLVGAGAFTTLLNGTDFGFDFNPTVDRIRIVSNAGQNMRINPLDATVSFVDGAIDPLSAVVSAAAYTNSFPGATTTVLFDIDATSGNLVKQDPPNDGVITVVGSLGLTIQASNGFDIGGASGLAYGIFTTASGTGLYSINLTSGAATAGPAFSQAVRGFTLGIGM